MSKSGRDFYFSSSKKNIFDHQGTSPPRKRGGGEDLTLNREGDAALLGNSAEGEKKEGKRRRSIYQKGNDALETSISYDPFGEKEASRLKGEGTKNHRI